MTVRRSVVLGLGLLACIVRTASGQTLPPLSADAGEESLRRGIGWGQSILPLVGATTEQVKGFYGKDVFSTLDQARFVYGYRTTSKTLTADLIALLFPKGFRFVAGTSVTQTGAEAGRTGMVADSRQLLERLQSGGDITLSVGYPLWAARAGSSFGYLFALPRWSFAVAGFGDSNTFAETTEHAVDLSLEGYYEMGAIDDAAAVFVGGRLGPAQQ